MPPRTPRTAEQVGLKLLQGRAHFVSDLRRKLLARGFAPDEVETALAGFKKRRYLDDETTARLLVRSRAERGGVGAGRLLQLLERHDVDPTRAAAWVSEGLREAGYDEEAEARRAMGRLSGARAARRLLALGFPPRLVSKVAGVEIPDE